MTTARARAPDLAWPDNGGEVEGTRSGLSAGRDTTRAHSDAGQRRERDRVMRKREIERRKGMRES